MSVQFLSQEYMEAATSALRDNADLAARLDGVSLALQFRVTAMPAGDELAYYLRIGDGRVEMAPGQLADADVRITNSYETAAGLAREEIKDQIAFLTGKLKVAGNMARLMTNLSVFMEIRRTLQRLNVEY